MPPAALPKSFSKKITWWLFPKTLREGVVTFGRDRQPIYPKRPGAGREQFQHIRSEQ